MGVMYASPLPLIAVLLPVLILFTLLLLAVPGLATWLPAHM